MSVLYHFWLSHLVCEKTEVLRLAVVTLSSLLFCLHFYLRPQLGYEKVIQNLSNFLLRSLQCFNRDE